MRTSGGGCRVAILLTVMTVPLQAQAARPPEYRHVLATAFDAPFFTDADMQEQLDDRQGSIVAAGGPVRFRFPRLTAVVIDGVRRQGRSLAPDVLEVACPAGAHRVAMLTNRDGLVPQATADGAAAAKAGALPSGSRLLKEGQTLVIPDGVYCDASLQLQAEGTPQRPAIVRSQTPGGATFLHRSQIVVRGRDLVLQGIRFEHVGPQPAVQLSLAVECRITQCHFLHCGDPCNTFANVVQIGGGSHRNRVDHCYFTGSKSMSVAQRIHTRAEVGTDNRIDHNLFRDIYRYWINGQENIQIGQNQRQPTGDARSRCLVEYNHFDHAWGDPEIISNKSSANVLRFNVAAHCQRSAFTLRGGNDVRFEGNLAVANGDGVLVMGRRATLVDNLMADQAGWGILLATGHTDGQSNVACQDATIARNTILDCAAGAIGGERPSANRPYRPARNTFRENRLGGCSGTLLDTQYLAESTITRNTFLPRGSAQVGQKGEEATVQAGQGLPSAKPIPRTPNTLPPRPGGDPIPDFVFRPPLLAPEAFAREPIFLQQANPALKGWRLSPGAKATAQDLVLSDGGAEPDIALPENFVLSWEYLPTAFTAQARLTFCAASGHGGFTLAWGGTDKDGKSSGRVGLIKNGSETTLVEGADVVYYYRDMRYAAWLGLTRFTSPTPDPRRWYRFTLLKQAARLVLLLGRAGEGGPGIPVIIWDDQAALGGPTPRGPGLRLAQRGLAHWRQFSLWHYGFSGDLPK